MGNLKIITLVSVFCLLFSAAEAKECLLSGKWKSDQEKTLKSMSKAKLTEKQRKILSNNFFGKLIVENTCKKTTSYFECDVETINYISLKENGNTVITEYYSELHQAVIKEKAVLDGECYYVPIESLNFNEYFCKIK